MDKIKTPEQLADDFKKKVDEQVEQEIRKFSGPPPVNRAQRRKQKFNKKTRDRLEKLNILATATKQAIYIDAINKMKKVEEKIES